MFKKMNFSSSNFHPGQNSNQFYAANMSRKPASVPIKPVALSAPMIDRVHRAKPGCSACGKRVA
jgi:hypothetical protein